MNYIILFLCSIFLPIISSKQIKPKLCIQCKHFIPDKGNGEFGKCSFFPRAECKINYLVNGENKGEYYYCSTARSSNNMCSEEGKYYKKKRVKEEFK
jgi:hypothetical protein